MLKITKTIFSNLSKGKELTKTQIKLLSAQIKQESNELKAASKKISKNSKDNKIVKQYASKKQKLISNKPVQQKQEKLNIKSSAESIIDLQNLTFDVKNSVDKLKTLQINYLNNVIKVYSGSKDDYVNSTYSDKKAHAGSKFREFNKQLVVIQNNWDDFQCLIDRKYEESKKNTCITKYVNISTHFFYHVTKIVEFCNANSLKDCIAKAQDGIQGQINFFNKTKDQSFKEIATTKRVELNEILQKLDSIDTGIYDIDFATHLNIIKNSLYQIKEIKASLVQSQQYPASDEEEDQDMSYDNEEEVDEEEAEEEGEEELEEEGDEEDDNQDNQDNQGNQSNIESSSKEDIGKNSEQIKANSGLGHKCFTQPNNYSANKSFSMRAFIMQETNKSNEPFTPKLNLNFSATQLASDNKDAINHDNICHALGAYMKQENSFSELE